jgi:hypothetical protein
MRSRNETISVRLTDFFLADMLAFFIADALLLVVDGEKVHQFLVHRAFFVGSPTDIG